MSFVVVNPYPQIINLQGVGLSGGSVYIGVANQDPESNPQAVYWNAALTIAASQPLAVTGGYIIRSGSPANAYCSSPYSIRVRDNQGVQVFYAASVAVDASPTYTPEQFGAKGDGVTDDSAAFQAGLNFVGAIGQALVSSSLSVTVCLEATPGKNYLIGDVTQPSYSGLTVSGNQAGRPQAILTQLPGSAEILGNPGAVTGVSVTGFMLRGTGATHTGVGLNFANALRSSFSDNYFDNFGMQGLLVAAGGGNHVNDNLAQNCLLNRAAVTSKHGAIEVGGTDCFIYDNEATASVTGSRTSANLYCCGIRIFGTNHFIHDIVGELSDVGLRIEGDLHRVENNRGDLNFGPGAEITGSVQASNNTWLNNSQHANGAYSGCVVSGNGGQYENNTSTTQGGVANAHQYGFEDTIASDTNKNTWGATNKSTGHTVQTYKIAAFAGSSVDVPSGQGKTFADGDTSPTVDNYGSFRADNSAPTSISTFDNCIPGQFFRVRFITGSTTILNGGGINTPTGAGVAFTAGQIQWFENDNGTIYFASHNP